MLLIILIQLHKMQLKYIRPMSTQVVAGANNKKESIKYVWIRTKGEKG